MTSFSSKLLHLLLIVAAGVIGGVITGAVLGTVCGGAQLRDSLSRCRAAALLGAGVQPLVYGLVKAEVARAGGTGYATLTHSAPL